MKLHLGDDEMCMVCGERRRMIRSVFIKPINLKGIDYPQEPLFSMFDIVMIASLV